MNLPRLLALVAAPERDGVVCDAEPAYIEVAVAGRNGARCAGD